MGFEIRHDAKVYIDGYTVVYPRPMNSGNRGKKLYDRKNKIREAGYRLNKQAKRKIRSIAAYKWLSLRNKDDLKFFTFTIPRSHYDQMYFDMGEKCDAFYIKKLGQLLDYYQNKIGHIKGYMWVAEKTQAGVIHFHALIECKFLSANYASSQWATRCGFQDHGNSVHFGFEMKAGGYKNVKIRNFNHLTKYMTKYISKGKNNEVPIYGRAYGMSESFTCLFTEGKCFREIEYIDHCIDEHPALKFAPDFLKGIAFSRSDDRGNVVDFYFYVKDTPIESIHYYYFSQICQKNQNIYQKSGVIQTVLV